MRTLLVVDAQGEVSASSNASAIGASLSHRNWFTVAKADNSLQTLYLTAPFKSLLSEHSVALVRTTRNAKGEFSGAVFAALHPDFAKVFLSSVVYTPDTLASLVHADGTVFSSTAEAFVGKNVGAPNSLFSRHRASAQAATALMG